MIVQTNFESHPLSNIFHDMKPEKTELQEKVDHVAEGIFKEVMHEPNVSVNLSSHSKTSIEEKQKEAIQSVSEIFSDQLLPNEKQKQLMEPVLRENLVGKDEPAVWLSKLFQGLSPSLWHLVFIHFHTEIFFTGCGFYRESDGKNISSSLDMMDQWPQIVDQSLQNLLNEEMGYFNITILKQILSILTKIRPSDGQILIGRLNFSESLIRQLLTALKTVDFDPNFNKQFLIRWVIGIYQGNESQNIKLQRIFNLLLICRQSGDKLNWLDHSLLTSIQLELKNWLIDEVERLKLIKIAEEESEKNLGALKINVFYQPFLEALKNSRFLEELEISMNTIEVIALLKKILSAFTRPAAL